jgi:hypothetical protein
MCDLLQANAAGFQRLLRRGSAWLKNMSTSC